MEEKKETKIIIDGVECENPTYLITDYEGRKIYSVREKLEPNGWVCESENPCIYRCIVPKARGYPYSEKPTNCVHGRDSWVCWKPFYGKTIEKKRK